MKPTIVLTLLITLFFLPPSFGATIIVPNHQPTIQAGIDAAVNGDMVLVRDGTWTGPGNWDIDFGGRAIAVASENGPQDCIIECWTAASENHRAFIFQSGEGSDSVVRGFTIQNGQWLDGPGEESGGGILCRNGSAPLITGNVITVCTSWMGAGISCLDSSPTIFDNRFQGNFADDSGGAIYCSEAAPLIAGNTIKQNIAQAGAGISCALSSTPRIVNNLIVENQQIYITPENYGSGIHITSNSVPLIENCTLADNHNHTSGCCIQGDGTSTITIVNSILWDNDRDINHESEWATPPTVTHSDVEDGWPGTGNLSIDPQFVPGSGGSQYLSQVTAGQASTSPCVDAGDRLSSALCYTAGAEAECLDDRSTRTDRMPDTGQVDMGYHFPSLNLVSAYFECSPASGTLPFSSVMTAAMFNNHPTHPRRLNGRIDITLGNGRTVSNWRSGYTNLAGGEIFSSNWSQSFPSVSSLLGDNRFELLVVDITPTPWNQPPYAPAGDTDQAACTVTATAP